MQSSKICNVCNYQRFTICAIIKDLQLSKICNLCIVCNYERFTMCAPLPSLLLLSGLFSALAMPSSRWLLPHQLQEQNTNINLAEYIRVCINLTEYITVEISEFGWNNEGWEIFFVGNFWWEFLHLKVLVFWYFPSFFYKGPIR